MAFPGIENRRLGSVFSLTCTNDATLRLTRVRYVDTCPDILRVVEVEKPMIQLPVFTDRISVGQTDVNGVRLNGQA